MSGFGNWQLPIPSPEVYEADKALFDLHHKEGDLDRFREDAGTYLDAYRLSERMRNHILNADIAGLFLAGINPYLLRAHCVGMGIPERDSVGALHALNSDTAHG